MKVISVRFVNRINNSLSKEYFYNIDDFLESYVEEYRIDRKETEGINFNTFIITNENSYDYKRSEVIITSIESPKKILTTLTTIIGLEFKSTLWMPSADVDRLNLNKNRINGYSLNEERKEENMFKKMMRNIEFGKVREVEMSMFGPAFKSDGGSRISYDTKKEEWVDVTDLIFDEALAYKMPVSIKDVKPNDFILHQGLWVRVVGINSNQIVAEKIFDREVVAILPVKNLFGFDFVTKLVYFDFGNMICKEGKEDNPFEKMLPFLMMKDSDSDILPMLMMMQNSEDAPAIDFSNPMMMYMMMKDSDSDILPMLMMMQNMNE